MTTTPSPPYNPWREFIENCISGDNYFRASEYREILDDIDGLTAERDTLKAELAALRSQEPVACYADHRLTPEGTTEFYGYADKKLKPSTMLYAAPVPAAPLTLTDEQVTRAAREISARQALICGIDPDDIWKQYGDDFKDEARAVLAAAKETK